MEFRTGFTHMEWFRKADGEVVFGEIAARPAGVRLVDAMNYASDVDLYAGWAEAVCHDRFSQPIDRSYNSGMVAKRAHGSGRIFRVDGLERLISDIGPHIAEMHIPAHGTLVGDWRRAAPAEGWIIVRHPDLQTTYELVDHVLRELQFYAG